MEDFNIKVLVMDYYIVHQKNLVMFKICNF